MNAVKTAESNHNFGPPPGHEDEIADLPCRVDDEEWPGQTAIFSVWEPSDEERKAIANGQNIRLGVGWLGMFPPVSLGVTHLTAVEDEVEEKKPDA